MTSTKTYRVKSIQEALRLIRRDLGPDASVLHTKEVRAAGMLSWISGARELEVTASNTVQAPRRMARFDEHFQPSEPQPPTPDQSSPDHSTPSVEAGQTLDVYESSSPEVLHITDEPETTPPSAAPEASPDLAAQIAQLQAMVSQLQQREQVLGSPASGDQDSGDRDWPPPLFQAYTQLIDAELNEQLARQIVTEAREALGDEEPTEEAVQAAIVAQLQHEVRVCPPIKATPGACRVAALVGPTGVGKTTTIAKLAANFRLREHLRVGLITVDTYRIAAVEQLRTYADIMDLPMSVVSTPKEMRNAVAAMRDLDLVLLDTAGRTPTDDIKIQELRAMLGEAQPDEVLLVLSGTTSENSLIKTTERFRRVGVSSLVLTKLDEATGLGALVALMRNSNLPISYLTDGQNVPDDIQTPNAQDFVTRMLSTTAQTENGQ